jgi:hypothetical protein
MNPRVTHEKYQRFAINDGAPPKWRSKKSSFGEKGELPGGDIMMKGSVGVNEGAGRNMIDRLLRHGGPGRGQCPAGASYRANATAQRNSLIKLDATVAG